MLAHMVQHYDVELMGKGPVSQASLEKKLQSASTELGSAGE
jgi:hypothetical protein